MMDRDSITRTGARAPGVGRSGPLARRCLTRASSLTQSREYTVKAVGTKDDGKPGFFGKALSDIRALKPYRGKLAVRNFRGGDGNVGIIRSPVRAIALPDNRHEAENEKVLGGRISGPLGPEFTGEAIGRINAGTGNPSCGIRKVHCATGSSGSHVKQTKTLGQGTATPQNESVTLEIGSFYLDLT